MDHIIQSDHAPQPSPFQTSLIGYSDSIIIHGGTFTQHNSSPLAQTAFEGLTKSVARGAFHNSADRFDPPKCHPRTRLAITERIMNWIQGKETTNDLIMWLHGPAGAGKSAIAQRIAELCHDVNLLLASFFCSRSDPRRNCAKYLVPTIAYQIARAFPGARALIEREITRDPLIFDQSLETQMVKLIVNPLQPLIDSDFFADPNSPRLVIIDGLDEVIDRQEQTRLLEAISNVLRRNHTPLILLIASRPEQEISYTFSSQPLAGLTARLLLDDKFHPDEDIRIFLDDSFSEIKVNHPWNNSILSSWPPLESIDQLVRKSSGQFIYASTVIRFVKSIRHRPADRLDIILGLRPVHRDLPFAELDALYMHILSSLEYPDQTLQIIGAIVIQDDMPSPQRLSAFDIEQLLGLELGDVDLYLADTTSLVSWDRGDQPVRILHASFGDFLFDPSRSGAFTMEIKAAHTMMTCHCLRHLIVASNSNLPEKYWIDQFPEYSIRNAAEHLSRSSSNPELMDLLQKLSFEDLIGSMHIHLATLLHQSPKDFVAWKIKCFSSWVWENVFNFVSATQALVCPPAACLQHTANYTQKDLDQSEYYDLQHRLFDRILIKGLESHHSRSSSLQFLLCLRVTCACDIRLRPSSYISRWSATACQLTDWKIIAPLQEMLFSHTILPIPDWYTSYFSSYSDSIILCEFLQDASRSKNFVVDADAYANASLSCLKYLTRFRPGARTNIHYTQRNLARRQNYPWHWRRQMKFVASQRMKKKLRDSYLFWKETEYPYTRRGIPYEDKFRYLETRIGRRRTYLGSTYLGLLFLSRALPLSAKSDDLVAFINADKSYSQHALQFPTKLKKCKEAMVTYLARVELQSSAGDA